MDDLISSVQRFQDETRRFRSSFQKLMMKSYAGRDGRYNRFVTGNCHRNTAFHCIIAAIPMTVILTTLNRFVSSVLDLGLKIGREFLEQISDGRFLFSRPLWSRRHETTSKNLGRLFGRCRVTDGRLPTLPPAPARY